ncbi:VOC family protein [Halpernia frigidisoli]|uniref:PhnB protein n=1 Tax=Halpernia frigidisoli TaxID=1125876 RepID=A0A1I3E9K7_9FLAO|nr:VOC family protein [Halpernia frigidisoli]SFH95636.1 PhnB protein [Halpernia frigidisoli]
MATINPYLMFDGNCKEAFEFYKSVFDTAFAEFSLFGDMPPQEGMEEISEEQKTKVMHAKLQISEETFLYGSDIMTKSDKEFSRGDGFQLSLDAKSRDEATNLFDKLSEGGNITMPLSGTFWGAYFGMWTDKFGVDWMVNYDEPSRIL